MNITVGVVLVVVILVAVAYVLFGTKHGERARMRISGTADEIASKDASTPEGAAAYYNVAIDKREEEYQAAYNIYTQMLGKIDSYEEQLHSMKKENMKLNQDIDSCIKRNDDEGATTLLKRQQDNDEKIEIIKNALTELRENSVLQKETVDNLYESLGDLKAEKESAILSLETAQVTKSLQVTPVANSQSDKMLEKVRNGVKKTTEEANGSKIAYENSSSVQQKRLDEKLKDEKIQSKLDELKRQKGIR